MAMSVRIRNSNLRHSGLFGPLLLLGKEEKEEEEEDKEEKNEYEEEVEEEIKPGDVGEEEKMNKTMRRM